MCPLTKPSTCKSRMAKFPDHAFRIGSSLECLLRDILPGVVDVEGC